MEERIVCPHCGAENETTDFLADCNPGQLEECECDECERGFGVIVEFEPRYEVRRVPCFDGQEHQWKFLDEMPEMKKKIYSCEHCGRYKFIKQENGRNTVHTEQ